MEMEFNAKYLFNVEYPRNITTFTIHESEENILVQTST